MAHSHWTHGIASDVRGKVHMANAVLTDKGFMAGVETLSVMCGISTKAVFIRTNRPVDCEKCHEYYGHPLDGAACECVLP